MKMKVSYELPEKIIASLKNLGIIPLEEKKEEVVEVWKPVNSTYWLREILNTNEHDEFSRSTKQRIENLKKLITEIAIIDSWACENNYKSAFNAKSNNYYVYTSTDNVWYKYATSHYNVPGIIYLTETGAGELVELLNAGRIKI